MTNIHKNYDSVFKEALSLFQNQALDFLGLTNIAPITEPLRTESVEIEIKTEFRDLTFGTKDGRGLHFEEEVDLSKNDLFRFSGYNSWLCRTYKREFITVVFVKNPSNITEVQTEQLHFKPIIVQCSKIDADAMLVKLKKDVAANKPINELEVVYLPLFRSVKLSSTELFKESVSIIKSLQIDDNRKRKIYALSIVLAGKIVDKATLAVVEEEVKKMGNVIIEYFEELGEKRGAERREEEIAKSMLDKGMDLLDIIEVTGLSVERIRKLRETIQNKAV